MKKSLFKLIVGLICFAGFGSANAVDAVGTKYTDSYAIKNRSTEAYITRFGASIDDPIFLEDTRSSNVSSFAGGISSTCSNSYPTSIIAYGVNGSTSFFMNSSTIGLSNTTYFIDYGASSKSTKLAEFDLTGKKNERSRYALTNDQVKEVLNLAREKGYYKVRFAIGNYSTDEECRTAAPGGGFKYSTTSNNFGMEYGEQRFYYMDANVVSSEAKVRFYQYELYSYSVDIAGGVHSGYIYGSVSKDTFDISSLSLSYSESYRRVFYSYYAPSSNYEHFISEQAFQSNAEPIEKRIAIDNREYNFSWYPLNHNDSYGTNETCIAYMSDALKPGVLHEGLNQVPQSCAKYQVTGWPVRIRIATVGSRYKTVENVYVYDTTYSKGIYALYGGVYEGVTANVLPNYATYKNKSVSIASTQKSFDFVKGVDSLALEVYGRNNQNFYQVLQYADASNGTSNLSWKDLATKQKYFGGGGYGYSNAVSIQKDGKIVVNSNKMTAVVSDAQLYSKSTAFRVKNIITKDPEGVYSGDASSIASINYSDSLIVNTVSLSSVFITMNDSFVAANYRNSNLVSQFGFNDAGSLYLKDEFGGSTAYDRRYSVEAYGLTDATKFFFKNGALGYGKTDGTTTKLKTWWSALTAKTASDANVSFNIASEAVALAKAAGYQKIRFVVSSVGHRTVNTSSTYTSSFENGTERSFFVDYVMPVELSKNLTLVSTYINSNYETSLSSNVVDDLAYVRKRTFEYEFTVDDNYGIPVTVVSKKIDVFRGNVKKVKELKSNEVDFNKNPSFEGTFYGSDILASDSVAFFMVDLLTQKYTTLSGKAVYDTVHTDSVEIHNLYSVTGYVGCDVLRADECGSMTLSSSGLLYYGTYVTATATPANGNYGFNAWYNASTSDKVSTAAVYGFSVTDNIYLRAYFVEKMGNMYISEARLSGKVLPTYGNNTDHMSNNFVLAREEMEISVSLPKGEKNRHVLITYCSVNDVSDFTGCNRQVLYWGLVPSKLLNDRYSYQVLDITRFGGVYGHYCNDVNCGSSLFVNQLDITRTAYLIMESFELDGAEDTYENAISSSTVKTNSFTAPVTTSELLGLKKDGIFLKWNNAIELYNIDGEKVVNSYQYIGLSYKLPTDGSSFGVPVNTESEEYTFAWEPYGKDWLNPEENKSVEQPGAFVSTDNTISYKVVVDTSCKVTFLDYDGTELQSGMVRKNTAATAPANPSRDGYVFAGWNKDFSKVTEPMTVTAVYADSYVAKKEIRANQCGDLWCGVKQDEKVNTGFSESQSGWWFGFTDKSYGGSSIVKYATGADVNANIQNAYSIDLTFDIEAGYDYPFAGIGFNLGNSENGKDISDWNGFCLAYKSSAAVSLQLVPENDMQVEYNYHFYSLAESSEISFVNVSWNQFGQESGWGKITGIDNILNSIKQIQIRATADADFKLVTLGRYGTCNGERYVAKKEIEESKCGDLWCGVKQETVVNTGFTGKDAGTFFGYNDNYDCSNETCGKSEVELSVGGDIAENIQKAYSIDLSFNNKAGAMFPYSGLGIVVADDGVDITDWDGLCLAYSSDKAVELSIADEDGGVSLGFDNYAVILPARTTVSFKNISWDDLNQAGWGTKADKSEILKSIHDIRISYHGAAGTSNNFKLVTLGRYNSCNGSSRVVLDWNDGDDDVVVNNLAVDGNTFVRIASDKQYYANGKIYEGVLTSTDLSDLAGATLKPISGVALSSENGEVEAELSGATIDDKLVIPAEISVAHIEIEREFKGTNSTLMVPFRVDVDTNDVKLVKVERVFKDTDLGQWVAEGTRAESIEAHTPYVINFTGKLSFDNVTLVPNVDVNTTATFGNWTFKGAYNGKTWTADDPEMGKAYGFSGVTKPEAGITQGQFVKIGNNAKVAPMRAYLVYEKKAVSPMPGIGIMKAAAVSAEEETLPSSIILRVVDKKNEVVEETVIETPVVENPAVDDVVDEVIQGIAGDKLNSVEEKPVRWYDFQGRRLHKKPTARGAYIKNNKNVLSK